MNLFLRTRTIVSLLFAANLHAAHAQDVRGQVSLHLTAAEYQQNGNSNTYRGFRILNRIPAINALLIATPQFVTAQQFVGTKGVMDANPNRVVKLCFTPNDPLFNSQWNMGRIGLSTGWELGRCTSATPVAVVDTGIQYTHPDLTTTYLTGGYDFFNNDNDPLDDFGHGTLVSGIISAATDNGVGIAGVAFGAPLIGIKVIGSNGSGTSFMVAQGISYAVTNTEARVINMSLGSSSPDANIEAACQLAADNGIVVVCGAGNNGNTAPFYPAYYKNCIAVGATDINDLRWTQSNYSDSWVRVAAPGADILSTNLGSGYGGISGTSMASPHVAGLAALLYERLGPGRNTVKAGLVRSWIFAGCSDSANWTTFGRVNASDSLRFARGVAPASFTWNPYVNPAVTMASCTDSMGNIYFTSTQSPEPNTNVLLEKRDSSGNLIWKKTLDGAGFNDDIFKLTVDTDGRIYLVGQAKKSNATTDALIACFTPTGGLSWKSVIDSPTHGNDMARSLVLAGDKVIATGDVSTDAANMTDAVVWMLKKTDGTILTTKQFNGPANKDDHGMDVVARSNGNVYIAAHGKATTSQNAYVLVFNPATLALSTLAGYDGLGANDFASCIRVALNGDAILGGYSIGVSDTKAFVARVKSAGGFLWTKTNSGSLRDMVLDTLGNVYWCGTENQALSNTSMVARKLNEATGSTVWERKFGGIGDTINKTFSDSFKRCLITGGSLVVSGTTTGPTQYDTTTCWLNTATGALLRTARYDAGGASDPFATLTISSTTKNIFVGCVSGQASGTQSRVLKYLP